MNSRERLLKALDKKVPDRLPVTTHHVMPCFLNEYMGGIHYLEFFDFFGLDPVNWVVAHRPDTSQGEYYNPEQGVPGFLEPRWICSDNWRIESAVLPDSRYESTRYSFITPERTLSMVLQRSSRTSWVVERLLKEKRDIDLIRKYAPVPLCNVDEVNREADTFMERGLIRGMVPGFDVYGQPGCWQDAAVLFGIEELIMQTFDDPLWVKELLEIMRDRKVKSIRSMEGARFDIIELGGGDASSTVISPEIFEEFVAPYDGELIAEARRAGQRIVYHTCGGMMPLLELIADMGPDAMETFTPSSLGGDVDLKVAKGRIGDRVCMIGGFDQAHHFRDCTSAETRRAVRDCFDAAGEGGGYILAPSDHFFDAEIELLNAFAEEAGSCIY